MLGFPRTSRRGHFVLKSLFLRLVVAGSSGLLLIWLGLWLVSSFIHGAADRHASGLSDPLPVISTLAMDWSALEPWSGRSINFHAGATRGRLLTPVATVALWLLVSAAVFILLSRSLAAQHRAGGLALLLLAGWLVLDLRWQLQLASRLVDTYHRFGSPASSERTRASNDGPLTAAMTGLRQKLPDTPSRIFILGKESNDYLNGRIRYHLLPHQVYGLTRLPGRNQIRVGNYVLVLAGISNVQFDAERQLLKTPRSELSVEPVASIRGFGALFRVKEIGRE